VTTPAAGADAAAAVVAWLLTVLAAKVALDATALEEVAADAEVAVADLACAVVATVTPVCAALVVCVLLTDGVAAVATVEPPHAASATLPASPVNIPSTARRDAPRLCLLNSCTIYPGQFPS